MVEVEEVAVLDRAFAGFCGGVAVDVAGRDSSIEGTSGVCFFCPPKENVRPEAFGSPPDDFGSGGTGTSTAGFFSTARHSSGPIISAEDGAVDALLWRDEFSVEEAVLVVFEEPLPRLGFRSANILSSAVTSGSVDLWMECVVVEILAPPSNGFVPTTSERSRTRKDGLVTAAFSSVSAVDFRLPNETENLGI